MFLFFILQNHASESHFDILYLAIEEERKRNERTSSREFSMKIPFPWCSAMGLERTFGWRDATNRH